VSEPPSGRFVYSPHLRTALVLTGTGTAGAYHAGVLRALHEAGVKIDVVAGRGIGAVSALFAAIDGGSRLWGRGGVWRQREASALYPWRTLVRALAWIAGAGAVLLTVPAALAAVGLFVYQLALLLEPAGEGAASGAARGFTLWVIAAFEPGGLPTLLPRIALLLIAVLLALVAAAAMRTLWRMPARRRQRDGFWWAVLGAPLSRAHAAARFRALLWELMSGGSPLRQPAPSDLARRYAELLAENLGQPGFRELLLVVHDLDARRDLAFALLADGFRRDFFLRRAADGGEPRSAEAFDLAGVARDLTLDAIEAALALPVAADPRLVVFPAEGYWRGEAHRLCDRPSALIRVLEEVAHAGVRQIIVVSASAETEGPHALTLRRASPRARLSEYLSSEETAATRDALRFGADWADGVFVVRPSHNPIGPLDLGGAYDQQSDRRQALSELIDRGYEDAYRQFIDPVIGGSGEAMSSVTT
jgi:hypothetical protein